MSTRDGGENVRDRQPVVGQGPGDARRAEKRARQQPNTAGFVKEADLASAEASLRAEVEAADAAALQAAIDAAAASDEAGAALFEAQFGSIAVGRLQAGTIDVAIELNSPIINAGGTTIDSNGITLNPGFGESSLIRLGSDASISSDGVGIGIGGSVTFGQRPSTGTVLFGIQPLATLAEIPSGSRTTDGINWIGASGGPNGSTSSAFVPSGGGSHSHDVQFHTHTITI